ncbi:hypothetical protein BHM03_00039207 [Ensete ventricosum]|nr:hypothetical protein BHM03_00039207 [Ensete ventricosum]
MTRPYENSWFSGSRLHDVVHSEKRIYLVFEYLDLDLKKHMDSCPEFSKDPRLIKVRGYVWCKLYSTANIQLFVQKMLYLEPGRRITARKALEHEYFKDLGMVP